MNGRSTGSGGRVVAFGLAGASLAIVALAFLAVRLAAPAMWARVADALIWLSPLSIKVLLAGLLLALAINLRAVQKALAVPRGLLLQVLAIVAASGLVRLLLPFTHRVYYDEDVYLQIAHNIAQQGRAIEPVIVLRQGSALTWATGMYPKWPNGWATLISFFSPHELVGAYAQSYAASLGRIAVVALIAWLLWSSRTRTLLAAAIVALLPANIIWGNTAAVESMSVLLVSLTFLALLVSRRLGYSHRSLVLLALLLATALQFRAETAPLFVVVMAIVLWELRAPGIAGGPQKAALFAGLGAALVCVHALHLAVISVDYDPSMGAGIGFGLGYITANLRTNGRYFFSSPVMGLTTAFAALGLVAGFRRSEVRLAFGVLAFYFCLFLGYFVGSYALPGLEKYAVLGLDAYALLAAYGGERLLQWGRLRNGRALDPLACPAPAIAFSLAFVIAGLVSLPIDLRGWHRTTEPAAQERAFIAACVDQLPQDALVITQIPSVFANQGFSAAAVATWPELAQKGILERYTGRIYLFSGLVPADMEMGVIGEALAAQGMVVVREEKLARQRFVLYLLGNAKERTP
jgi:hypothetical protein